MAEEIEAIERFIRRLERHQEALNLNDDQFVARYQHFLGSVKTWRYRLVGRSWKNPARGEDRLNVAKWEKRLQQLCAKLDGGSDPITNFYAEMPFTRKMEAAVAILQGQTNDRRNLYSLATTGVGKSVFARDYCGRNRSGCAYVRMRAPWRNKEGHICRGLAFALGAKEEGTAAAGLQVLVDYLQANPLTVFIDEAHEGGVGLMKIVKTLIDETPAKFVQLCYPTEFDRVKVATAGSLDEAKQLLGRTLKPIFDEYRDGLGIDDITIYLQKAAGLNGDARDVAGRVLPLVRTNGNLRVLCDAVEEARMIADQRDEEVRAGLVVQSLETMCQRRASRQTGQ